MTEKNNNFVAVDYLQTVTMQLQAEMYEYVKKITELENRIEALESNKED